MVLPSEPSRRSGLEFREITVTGNDYSVGETVKFYQEDGITIFQGDCRHTPLVIDLCCGQKGGWAKGFLQEGYRVIGLDITDCPEYPGEFYKADVRRPPASILNLSSKSTVIVASPPCEEFTRHQLPWTARRNPPEPDLSIIDACWRFSEYAARPIVLENVRNAQRWIGTAKAHYGSRYLWGDVPALLPYAEKSRKSHMSSTARAERAKIPFDLAVHIARCFHP